MLPTFDHDAAQRKLGELTSKGSLSFNRGIGSVSEHMLAAILPDWLTLWERAMRANVVVYEGANGCQKAYVAGKLSGEWFRSVPSEVLECLGASVRILPTGMTHTPLPEYLSELESKISRANMAERIAVLEREIAERHAELSALRAA